MHLKVLLSENVPRCIGLYGLYERHALLHLAKRLEHALFMYFLYILLLNCSYSSFSTMRHQV